MNPALAFEIENLVRVAVGIPALPPQDGSEAPKATKEKPAKA